MSDYQYSSEDYAAVFKEIAIAPHQSRMLQAHLHATNFNITAKELAWALGYRDFRAVNRHYGTFAQHVGERLGWKPLPEQYLGVLVTFEKPEKEWHWILRPAVVEALKLLGPIEGNYPILPEEVIGTTQFQEGSVRQITVNAYERSDDAREKCILHYGCRCWVCGLILAEIYGEAAQGLIHVHHLRELASIKAKYFVDPIEDLRPVCPNCHSVIHNRRPAFTIEEVKQMIAKEEKRKRK
jgi:predicted HNH restriction endonuclease